jgi:hypothetical protein
LIISLSHDISPGIVTKKISIFSILIWVVSSHKIPVRSLSKKHKKCILKVENFSIENFSGAFEEEIKLCDLEIWVSAADGVLCWAGGIAACLKEKN